MSNYRPTTIDYDDNSERFTAEAFRLWKTTRKEK